MLTCSVQYLPEVTSLMDAYSTDRAGFSYSDDAPILLTATSDRAMAIAERTIEASGLRLGAKVALEAASERIDLQARTSAVWL